MLQNNVMTEEERNRNFFEADERERKSVSELEHLRRKGRAISEFCSEIRDIFGKTNAEDMARAWGEKLNFLRSQFKPWPDTGEDALGALARAIGEQLRELREAEEERNRLRGIK